MKQEYSFNIIKFIYKELSLTDYLETEYATQTNEEWKQEYDFLRRAYQLLPKVSFYPKKSTVNNIISYSINTAE